MQWQTQLKETWNKKSSPKKSIFSEKFILLFLEKGKEKRERKRRTKKCHLGWIEHRGACKKIKNCDFFYPAYPALRMYDWFTCSVTQKLIMIWKSDIFCWNLDICMWFDYEFIMISFNKTSLKCVAFFNSALCLLTSAKHWGINLYT